jgi:hypothetical protein
MVRPRGLREVLANLGVRPSCCPVWKYVAALARSMDCDRGRRVWRFPHLSQVCVNAEQPRAKKASCSKDLPCVPIGVHLAPGVYHVCSNRKPVVAAAPYSSQSHCHDPSAVVSSRNILRFPLQLYQHPPFPQFESLGSIQERQMAYATPNFIRNVFSPSQAHQWIATSAALQVVELARFMGSQL